MVVSLSGQKSILSFLKWRPLGITIVLALTQASSLFAEPSDQGSLAGLSPAGVQVLMGAGIYAQVFNVPKKSGEPVSGRQALKVFHDLMAPVQLISDSETFTPGMAGGLIVNKITLEKKLPISQQPVCFKAPCPEYFAILSVQRSIMQKVGKPKALIKPLPTTTFAVHLVYHLREPKNDGRCITSESLFTSKQSCIPKDYEEELKCEIGSHPEDGKPKFNKNANGCIESCTIEPECVEDKLAQ